MMENFAARRDRLRDLLAQNGLDAALVHYAANRYYLSGFELHDVQLNESAGSLIVGADGRDVIVTDPRYEEVACDCLGPGNVVIYTAGQVKCLAEQLRSFGSRIGIELEAVSASFFSNLRNEASSCVFEADDGLVEGLRTVKDEEELKSISASFALNHAMLAWLEKTLKPGLREDEVAWMIERYFREHGAQELAFPSIVAVGANAARPHAIPGSQKIEENSFVLVDVGCRVDGYCSDQTRTFFVGDAPDGRFKDTLALVREAQTVAIEFMKPGVALADVHARAKSVFEQMNVAQYFTHGLGHGVGLETHEKPSLSPRGEGVLKVGMVVTVEPGLYYPGWGGVRWEHTVRVHEHGVSIL